MTGTTLVGGGNGDSILHYCVEMHNGDGAKRRAFRVQKMSGYVMSAVEMTKTSVEVRAVAPAWIWMSSGCVMKTIALTRGRAESGTSAGRWPRLQELFRGIHILVVGSVWQENRKCLGAYWLGLLGCILHAISCERWIFRGYSRGRRIGWGPPGSSIGTPITLTQPMGTISPRSYPLIIQKWCACSGVCMSKRPSLVR